MAVSTYPYNEPELLMRIAQGDERAFARMIDKYTTIVYSHLFSYLKNAEKAEEITWAIFLRIWKNRAKSALKELLTDLHQTPIDPLQDFLVNPQSVAVEVKELSSCDADWFSGLQIANNDLSFIVAANGTTAARSTTIRLHYLAAIGITAKNSLKINQLKR